MISKPQQSILGSPLITVKTTLSLSLVVNCTIWSRPVQDSDDHSEIRGVITTAMLPNFTLSLRRTNTKILFKDVGAGLFSIISNALLKGWFCGPFQEIQLEDWVSMSQMINPLKHLNPSMSALPNRNINAHPRCKPHYIF